MATIDSKEIIDNIIAHNGLYEDDDDELRVVKVVSYINAWGGQTYGVIYEGEPEPDRYEQDSPFTLDSKVIWEYQS